MRRVGPFGSADGTPFEQGTGNDDGSFIPAAFFTVIREELAHLVEHAGIALSGDDSDLQQVRKAVAAMIAASAISGLKELAYLAVGHGLESDGAGNARVKLNGATLARAAAGLALNLGSANVWFGTQSGTEVDLIDAATIVWDLAVAQEASITLGGNRSIGTINNLVNGTYYSLFVVQPASGGPYIPSFTASFTGTSGVTFTTAANAIDHLVFRARGGKLRLVSFAPNVGA